MSELTLTYDVQSCDLTSVGEASSRMKLTLKKLGLPHEAIRRAAICMYEGEINMVIHADGGRARVTVGMDEITISLTDTGPGIPNIARAMEEGYSTAGEQAREMGFGAGMGLPNMKRYSDEMTVESKVGEGTTVTMRIRVGD